MTPESGSPDGFPRRGGGASAADVIWAVASPLGSSERGVIRVSGTGAPGITGAVVQEPAERFAERGIRVVHVPVLGHPVPGLALSMPGPRSFTGEDVVELHLPGSPLLLAEVGAALTAAGARPAGPGEFTRRAFENGRLTLSEAEAVLDLIQAEDAEAARRATTVLDGGVDRAVDSIRGVILDARALLEAGLDFEDGETGDVDPAVWQAPLHDVLEKLRGLSAEQPLGSGARDLVLLGPANAGKSSLCNALLGRSELLVSDVPGTTRDVLEVELPGGGPRLFDAPGDLAGPAGALDAAALDLRARLLAAAVGAVVVLDASRPSLPLPELGGRGAACVVWTHVDLLEPRGSFEPRVPEGLPAGLPVFAVDALRGAGVPELGAFLRRTAVAGRDASGVRIADALARARAAVEAALAPGSPELLAAELDVAIACLDEVSGASTPEDVLDRIFGRFCLGK